LATSFQFPYESFRFDRLACLATVQHLLPNQKEIFLSGLALWPFINLFPSTVITDRRFGPKGTLLVTIRRRHNNNNTT
jgi:hypothetical protein